MGYISIKITARTLHYRQTSVAGFSLLRVLGTVFSVIAIDNCGSATYQLLYSSLPIFSAVLNFFYRRKTSLQQNMCLGVIIVGIYASTLGSSASAQSNKESIANTLQLAQSESQGLSSRLYIHTTYQLRRSFTLESVQVL